MANESQLRASEIKDVLLSQIQNYEEALHAEEAIAVQGLRNPLAFPICAFARVQLLPPDAAQAPNPCPARACRTDTRLLLRVLAFGLVRPALRQ